MSDLRRRLTVLEQRAGLDDSAPRLVREYVDGDTGEVTRLHLRGGHIERVEAFDGSGNPFPACQLWDALEGVRTWPT